jgi:hypothetical protein
MGGQGDGADHDDGEVRFAKDRGDFLRNSQAGWRVV